MAKYKGFSQVELRRPTRSTFDLSHEKKLSTRIGKLTPIFITETMPNDTFYGSTEVLLKLAPLKFPMYQRLNLYVHYFFVPNRLLWESWESFITGGRLGEEMGSLTPVPPNFQLSQYLPGLNNSFDIGSIADYLGIPPIPDADVALWGDRTIDAMPFGAVYKCWMDYYRDRNYTPENEVLPMIDGDITPTGPTGGLSMLLTRYRCWEHDYFTSSLPFTQRGAEVLMPLQGSGTVSYMPESLIKNAAGALADTAPLGSDAVGTMTGFAVPQQVRVENIDEVELQSSDVSINDLRRAVRLQEWLERNALAGSRYNESIMAHFGRKTSDGRLQRAEYLGGGKAVVQISEIMTTAYSEDASSELIPPASPSGRGSTYADTNRFSYNCEEHGFIVGIMSVMPSSAYTQGLPRMFQQRNTFLDYPWPTFAHLGEQEVYDNEIYADPTSVTVTRQDQPVFGYQSRYSDWKFISSSVHGDFRTSLQSWHMAREFGLQPNLGEAFVTYDDANQDRVFNVSGVDTLWCYIYNKINVKRSLPYFGTPML